MLGAFSYGTGKYFVVFTIRESNVYKRDLRHIGIFEACDELRRALIV